MAVSTQKNILGHPLQACSHTPCTGFYRDGFCHTGEHDVGSHTVCAVMNDEFLIYSKKMGNDLSTPMPQFNFPGLKAGDRWCLCASRWLQAWEHGVAPMVILECTHERAQDIVPRHHLLAHALQ